MRTYGRMAGAFLAGIVLAAGAAACGAGASGAAAGAAKGGAAAVSVPTTLPAGATLGCDQPPASNCAYGGAASAPSGIKTAAINTQITADMFKLTAPMALTADKSAPGGKGYIGMPAGTGNTTSQLGGNAQVAVNIPTDGYYIIWAATQSGDTTTGTDSFFVGFGSPDPAEPNLDFAWSITPDGTWHVHDSTGGCMQLVHQGTNDKPNGCDTWHFKKGVLVINIDGREDNSHLAWLEVSPANPKQPLPDARG